MLTHLAARHGLAVAVELVRLVRLLARIGLVIDVVAGLVQIGGGLGLYPGAADGHQGGGKQKSGGFHDACPVVNNDAALSHAGRGPQVGARLMVLWAIA